MTPPDPIVTECARVRRVLSRCLALIACLTCFGAAAQEGEQLLEGWRWVRYGVNDGLSEGAITQLVETPDGTMWASSTSGLAWFDDFRWHRAKLGEGSTAAPTLTAPGNGGELFVLAGNSAFRGDRRGFRALASLVLEEGELATSFARLPDDSLLIVLDKIPVKQVRVVRLRNETLEPVPMLAEDLSSSTCSLVQLDSGRVLFGTHSRMLEWRNDGFVPWMEGVSVGGPSGWMVETPEGEGVAAIRFPYSRSGIYEWQPGGRPERVESEGPISVDRIALSRQGEALAQHDTSQVRVRRGGRWASVSPANEAMRTATRMSYDSGGDLWIGTTDGLYLCDLTSKRWQHYRSADADSTYNRVNDLAKGPAGEIVAVTAGGPLTLVPGPSRLDEVPMPGNLVNPTGLSFDVADRLWVGSGGAFAGARIWNGSAWEVRLHGDDGTPLGLIHAIHSARDGSLWLLALASAPESAAVIAGDVHVFDGRRLLRWSEADALRKCRVYDMVDDEDGTLWFATSDGLRRHRDGAWTVFSVAEGFLPRAAFAIASDGHHGVWFASNAGGGLFHVDAAGALTHEDITPDLASSAAWDLVRDDAGRLWLATSGGLACRWPDGTWAAVNSKHGILHPVAWPLLLSAGKLFIGTRGGGTYALDLATLGAPAPLVEVTETRSWDRNALFRWNVHPLRDEQPQGEAETRWRLDEGEWSPWTREREMELHRLKLGVHRVELQSKNLLGAKGEVLVHGFGVAVPQWKRAWFSWVMGGVGAGGLGLAGAVLLRRRREQRRLHEVEGEARASERRLARVLHELPDPFLSVDEQWRVTWLNEAAAQFLRRLGRKAAAAEGEPFDELLAEILTPEVREQLSACMKNRSAAEIELLVGPLRAWHSLRALPSGEGLDIVLQDVTERRRLSEERVSFERKLADAQRFQSLGVLAGGIAHDFNNLLLAIRGNAEVARHALAADDPIRQSLRHVEVGCQRAAELTQQLLDHAGKSSLRREAVDMNRLVSDMGELLRTGSARGAALDFDLTPDLAAVTADAGRLQQVVLNLIVNASEALPEGRGHVRVRTSMVLRGGVPNVLLSVEDDGLGMDEATRSHIFEPFFTTKASGRGLGLSAVRGIVESHGGSIEVETIVGKGSRFSVFLPPTGRIVIVPAPPPVAEARQGQGTVLVVDDDEFVRRAICSLLVALGHVPVQAASGEEAVRRFLENPAEFASAVVDMTMPGLDGAEVARRLHRARPGLPIVLVSGWARDDVMRDGMDLPGVMFLQKPFSGEQLEDALGRTRAQRRDAAS